MTVAIVVGLFALVLLLIAVPSIGVRFECPARFGRHDWMHERTADGWRLRCRACLRTTRGLSGVFTRSPHQ